jgi:glycerol-3-phosphate acyltransferase PlsY
MSVLGFISIVVLVLYILGSILYAFITRQAHDDFRKHR